MSQPIFLTGITGSVGSGIARQWLENGARVVALVRAESEAKALQRVTRVLTVVGADPWLDQVTVVCGDICQPGLGLRSDASLDVSSVIH
ncbi:MAG: SDR family oxidoreductase, partial [Phycisphaeraceae bacterium]|nr:SDR family oxidoreductase [Phycisphaeraceae bacterium]